MKITIDLPDEPLFWRGIPMPVEISLSPVIPANDLPESDGMLVAYSDRKLSRCEAGDLPLGVVPDGHGPYTAGKWGWVISKGYTKVKVGK